MGPQAPLRSRLVAAAVVGVSLVLVLWGYAEAMRVLQAQGVGQGLAVAKNHQVVACAAVG